MNKKSDQSQYPWQAIKERAEMAYSCGDYDLCIGLWDQVMSMIARKSGPDYCRALDRQGDALLQIGQYTRAEDNYFHSLELKFAALGRTHACVAQSYGNMARVHYVTGDYERSERWALDCAAMYVAVLGPESKPLACALHNLATLYQAQKRYDLAESFYEKAMEMKLNVFGQAHLEFVNLLRAYAHMLRQVGRESDAEHLDQCASGKISGKWLVPDQKVSPFKTLQIEAHQ